MTHIKTNMASNVTVETVDTVSYMKDGQWITEPKRISFGSDHSTVQQEPAPAATYAGYERVTVELGYEDSAEAAFRKQGEFIQQQLNGCLDKDGQIKQSDYHRAVAWSAQLEQLAESREADAQMRKMRAQREAQGLASPGGLLYEANEKGGTVTVFHGQPSAQDQFNALVKQIDANRRG